MRFERIRFEGDATGPGQVFDRTDGEPNDGVQGFLEELLRSAVQAGGDPPGEGALHPFSPRVSWANHQTALESRRALGLDEGVGDRFTKEPNRQALAGGDSLRALLLTAFTKLADRQAGGNRVNPEDLLPEMDLPDEGTIPDEFLAELTNLDWFDPTAFDADPANAELASLSGLKAASGPIKEGKGMDFYRTGEAPNNYQNRNNPLYEARREFAMAIAPQLEKMFGVSARGSAGYKRPFSSSDAAPGGRSGNSDHYSGGAIDFFGNEEDLTRMRNWLAEHAPWISFARWKSESHFDHVHASIDLGWIAENYYKGRTIPQIDRRSRSTSAPAAAQRSRPATPATSRSERFVPSRPDPRTKVL